MEQIWFRDKLLQNSLLLVTAGRSAQEWQLYHDSVFAAAFDRLMVP